MNLSLPPWATAAAAAIAAAMIIGILQSCWRAIHHDEDKEGMR